MLAKAEEIRDRGETKPRLARDPVNQPMINNWVEAMGDDNPRYLQGEAPPAMAQVWTMGGLHPQRDPSDPLHSMMEVLTDSGFTGVLGTNCEQTYERYLRVGEQLSVTTRLESVVGPKQTGVGEGYFVTTRNTWYVATEEGDEVVASM
ncbi:MAG: MaoC family dehydratase N-terminal domain-containing protein, partial [Actinomycetota bacterium]|nr:MaoC family dehydratase N-terminal domain-containing protein [Actinomycetota bacterium]